MILLYFFPKKLFCAGNKCGENAETCKIRRSGYPEMCKIRRSGYLEICKIRRSV